MTLSDVRVSGPIEVSSASVQPGKSPQAIVLERSSTPSRAHSFRYQSSELRPGMSYRSRPPSAGRSSMTVTPSPASAAVTAADKTGRTAADDDNAGRAHEITCRSADPCPRWMRTSMPSRTGVMQARWFASPSTIIRQSEQRPTKQKPPRCSPATSVTVKARMPAAIRADAIVSEANAATDSPFKGQPNRFAVRVAYPAGAMTVFLLDHCRSNPEMPEIAGQHGSFDELRQTGIRVSDGRLLRPALRYTACSTVARID